MIKKPKNFPLKPYFFSFCICLLILQSCSNEDNDDEPKEIEIISPDEVGGLFIAKPYISGITRTSSTLNYQLSERAEVVISLRVADGPEAENSPITFSRSVIAYHEMQQTFTDLNPETTYLVNIVGEDRDGNSIEKIEPISFTTSGLKKQIVIAGEIPVAYEGVQWGWKPSFALGGEAIELVSIIDPAIESSGIEEPQLKIEMPHWVSWDPRAQQFHGIPLASKENRLLAKDISIKIMINSAEYEGEAVFSGEVVGDPLMAHSWQMNNIGQYGFSHFYPIAGFDLNMKKSISGELAGHALTGKGTLIRIVSTHIQADHPDLADNFQKGDSRNYFAGEDNCFDCEPDFPSKKFDSMARGEIGTAMAGVIAGKAWNGIGGRGVAPEAKFSGYNIFAIEDLYEGLEQEIDVATFREVFDEGADVIVLGGGPITPVLPRNLKPSLILEERMNIAATQHRQGRGTLIVQGAGDWGHLHGHSPFDPMRTSPYNLVVGAVNSFGKKASYSSPGANIWISAPGGEAGWESDAGGFSSEFDRRSFSPGILTTDIFDEELPCEIGYAKGMNYFEIEGDFPETNPDLFSIGPVTGFNIGWDDKNRDCQYTSAAFGTSLAAAHVAGAAALLLEVNPSLSVRDIKHIFARTARVVDETNREFAAVDGNRVSKTLPWSQNAKGYNFHNHYGFGLIDIDAAVALANPASYQNLPPQIDTDWMFSENPSFNIPVYSSFGATSQLDVAREMQVETVLVEINLNHVNMSHFQFELKSPSGTRSVLLPLSNGSFYGNYDDMRLQSNAFYEELATGTWELKAIDSKSGQGAGVVTTWSMRILGRN